MHPEIKAHVSSQVTPLPFLVLTKTPDQQQHRTGAFLK